MGGKRGKGRKKSKYLREQGSQADLQPKSKLKRVVVSYFYLDIKQGQTLEKWDETPGRLLKWEKLITQLNSRTIRQAITDRIIIVYKDLDADIHNMPKKSKWKFPEALKGKDITWCKIEVMQKVRVIGFMEDNIFYAVFLDEDHEFFPTEPRNT
ncbi:MAG: hypothetical protein CMP59_05690 [Flavobacteriales bacterium]|nr:hypothetical protein [Flavobacteriales bacterium]